MRFIRCAYEDEVFYGLLQGDGEVLRLAGPPYGEMLPTGQAYALASVRLLTPCVPSKAVCVGVNYRAHALEMGDALPAQPLIFLKPPTALLDPGEAIWYPPQTKNLHYEAELAIVIGRAARQVSIEEAPKYIFGYTCANDVTARDLQPLDGQWTRAKGFDTFLPLGPWIETEADPSGLRVRLLLNGDVKQNGNTDDLIFDVPTIVSFVSGVMTLLPGDVILTGTPSGVGPMVTGDRVEVEIEGIGTLMNIVGGHER